MISVDDQMARAKNLLAAVGSVKSTTPAAPATVGPLDPSTWNKPLSPEDAAKAASIAASTGAASTAASTAATNAGEQQQKDQTAAMGTASDKASQSAGAPVTPAAPYTSPAGDAAAAYVNKQASTLGQDPGAVTDAGKDLYAYNNGLAANLGKDPGQISDAGKSAADYITKKAATLGGDPGYDTEAGKLYADRVTNGLKTPDASSVNVQNTTDTNAARNAYLAKLQAGETIGQSGFAPGSAQAQRIQDQSQAGVNSANQAGQSAANSYLRQRTQDNMAAAKGLEDSQHNKTRENLADANTLETQQYNRNQTNIAQVGAQEAQGYSRTQDALGNAEALDNQGYGRSEKATDRGLQAAATQYAHGRDTIGDVRAAAQTATDNAHWDTMNKEQQDQLAVENKTVAAGTDETKKRNLLAGLPEGPAKNTVMAGLADGSLTTATALAKVMNPDGSIKPEYRGIDPATAEVQGTQKQAEAWVAATTDLKTGTPEFTDAVRKRMADLDAAVTNPTKTAATQAAADEAAKNLNNGTGTPSDFETAKKQGTIPSYTTQNLPNDDGAAALIGKTISMNGEQYTVVANGRVGGGTDGTHRSYVVMQDPNGKVMYKVDGKFTADPPMNEGGSHLEEYGLYAVYDPATKTVSYKPPNQVGK